MKIRITHILFILMMMFAAVGYSQERGGNNSSNGNGKGKGKGPPVPFGPPHPELPIDSGISVLLLAGACYGAFALRKKIVS